MEIVTINQTNIESEHICCAIGNDKENKARAQTKKDWMKDRFKDGLVFKRFDQRGKLFIEYMPIEKAWKPLTGNNYMVINCLWVSGQFKGKGLSTLLLRECLNDAKINNMDGVCVVSSNKIKPFLTDKKFYMKNGFVVADTAPPYFELLVLKLNESAPSPRFMGNAKNGSCGNTGGFTFIYSNQCPFMEEYVRLLAAVLDKKGIPYVVKKIGSGEEAREIGSPFGTLGIYYNGEFKTHELMPEKKFESFIQEVLERCVKSFA